jgi:hypothetical protein
VGKGVGRELTGIGAAPVVGKGVGALTGPKAGAETGAKTGGRTGVDIPTVRVSSSAILGGSNHQLVACQLGTTC